MSSDTLYWECHRCQKEFASYSQSWPFFAWSPTQQGAEPIVLEPQVYLMSSMSPGRLCPMCLAELLRELALDLEVQYGE